ncbi:type VI secretion system Vgr family protein [Melittangium boletus]|uniref:Type IV secretion protein Rhs n=1 Tax=Melittangium boletus DSM 14713 TaxID=1294270 RepID=A0A286NUV5_9BACT|nr:type VI secretion system tip protein VgrG [Melittangium boletus]ATB26794.1 type IV secretion protein Rhs [Melittangium boletus DSM 14713]
MTQTQGTAFTFQAGSFGVESLAVDRLDGMEGLSRLYEFRVDFHPTGEDPLDTESLIGVDALLTVEVRGGRTRQVHGMVCRVEMLGPQGGRWRYRAWIVPRLWRLTLVRRSRIFQGKTVPDILKAVLGEAGLKVELRLSRSYEPREYCTQYRETDFAFLSRLMEWEGLFYFFAHTEEGHELVVGDAPNVHEALPGGLALPVREKDERVEEGEYLHALERVHRLRSGAVHLKDYDFEKPTLDMSGKATSGEGQSSLEVYDYPGEYVAPAVGRATAKVRLEEAVQAARSLVGEGVAPSLTPGFRFQVEDDGRHAGEYSVVEVVHSGWQPEMPGGHEALGGLYQCRFKCMPARVPFRPPRTTDVPRLAGIQTATVVGPSGEELHTDEHGRIKVQFHWDREGKRDDKASCWVRVGQAWGGTAWGALYLPRIGQEVVVRFLEGNPDRPLIAGTVYNGVNSTPYALPDEKTKSTLKSASSLGSNGFNEFRIEDLAGEEEIFVHGQKDEELVTENDKGQQVRGYEDLLVKKDRAITVEGNQRLDVMLDDSSLIDANQTLQVRGNRATATAGSHDETVEGNQSISVAQCRDVSIAQAALDVVGAAKALTIGAMYDVSVELDMNEAVGGLNSIEVGGTLKEHIDESRQEIIAGDKEIKVGGNFQSQVKEQASLTTGKDLNEEISGQSYAEAEDVAAVLAKSFALKADKFILVVNGKLAMQIEKSGKVQLFGNNITLED